MRPRNWAGSDIEVRLIVCLDVTLPPPVPGNVRRAINLRRTLRRLYPAMPLVAAPGRAVIENIDLDATDSPIDPAGIWHVNITSRPRVRQFVVGRILLVDEVAPALLAQGVLGLTMDLDDDDADVASPVPPPEGEHTPRALVSVWVDCYDRRARRREDPGGGGSVRLDGYQVLESLYTDYGTSRWARRATGPTAGGRPAF